jgi:hypothetical protein
MSIFVVYLKLKDSPLYTYQDFEDKTSWLEVVSSKEDSDMMKYLFQGGWVPLAYEVVYDSLMISHGQAGISSRIQDLTDQHGQYDFKPLWPEKTSAIAWKEGQKICHEVWSEQERKNIDFSKITEDLCKGVGGSNYH